MSQANPLAQCRAWISSQEALERKASAAPWDTINHETGCPSFGYCSPNGCGGHESNVAYDVAGPMLLRDGEVSGASEEEDRQQFRQADSDAKFIKDARNSHPRLLAVARAAIEMVENCPGCLGCGLDNPLPVNLGAEPRSCPTCTPLRNALGNLIKP